MPPTPTSGQLSALVGRGQPGGEPPRAVPSGLARSYTAAEQQAPLDAYTAMVAGHDASAAQKLYTGDYLQHGPFGPNVTRSEFEAGNRDIVWKAMPDISIQLTPFLADGELVAYRGLGQGTHTGAELFGVPPAGRHVSFTETHIVRLRGTRSASTGFGSTCSACSASSSPSRPGPASCPRRAQRWPPAARQPGARRRHRPKEKGAPAWRSTRSW